jgi:hypothetical protein
MSFKDLLDKETRESMDVLDGLMKKDPKELTSGEFQESLKHGKIVLDGFNKLFEKDKDK